MRRACHAKGTHVSEMPTWRVDTGRGRDGGHDKASVTHHTSCSEGECVACPRAPRKCVHTAESIHDVHMESPAV